MATIAGDSTNVIRLFVEGSGPRFGFFKLTGVTTSDSVALSTTFSRVSQAAGVTMVTVPTLSAVAFSGGTTGSLSAFTTIAAGSIVYLGVVGEAS